MTETLPAHIVAWRKWRSESDRMDNNPVTNPGREARKQARIVRLKNDYERLLQEAKAAGIV